jgi:hypothetical protein
MLVDWNEQNRGLAKEYGEGPFEVLSVQTSENYGSSFKVWSPKDETNYWFFSSRFDVIEDNQSIDDLL